MQGEGIQRIDGVRFDHHDTAERGIIVLPYVFPDETEIGWLFRIPLKAFGDHHFQHLPRELVLGDEQHGLQQSIEARRQTTGFAGIVAP